MQMGRFLSTIFLYTSVCLISLFCVTPQVCAQKISIEETKRILDDVEKRARDNFQQFYASSGKGLLRRLVGNEYEERLLDSSIIISDDNILYYNIFRNPTTKVADQTASTFLCKNSQYLFILKPSVMTDQWSLAQVHLVNGKIDMPNNMQRLQDSILEMKKESSILLYGTPTDAGTVLPWQLLRNRDWSLSASVKAQEAGISVLSLVFLHENKKEQIHLKLDSEHNCLPLQYVYTVDKSAGIETYDLSQQYIQITSNKVVKTVKWSRHQTKAQTQRKLISEWSGTSELILGITANNQFTLTNFGFPEPIGILKETHGSNLMLILVSGGLALAFVLLFNYLARHKLRTSNNVHHKDQE
jgi:hypothetical protein